MRAVMSPERVNRSPHDGRPSSRGRPLHMLPPMERAVPGRPSSLRVRLGLVALVFMVLVLIAVGMSTLMLRSWDRTLDRRVATRQMVNDVAHLQLAFTDQETGLRGYQLTLDPVFLEPYEDGEAVARAIMEQLAARDDELDLPGFDRGLSATAAAADRWKTEFAVPTIADPSSAPAEEVERVRFDELRAELDALEQLVDDELARLDDDARRVRRNVFVVLFGSAVTAIAGTAFAAVLFRRWVIQPLHQVGAAARALADDDTYPLPTFDSPELQDVSDAVGSLQRSLRSARDEAVAALSGLEQSAVLALQVRNQLADEIGRMPAGWTADSMLVPAEGVVAGDCFDVGLLDANHLYVVVIDVTGHGAASALDALKAKSQLRAAIRSRLDPGPAIDWLSREMLKDEHTDLLTASVTIIDLTDGRIHYANAGHPPALLTDGNEHIELEPTGPLIGAFAATWRTATAVLPPGWTLFVHTDGLTDTVGAGRERFGERRLQACFDDPDPERMLTCVRQATDDFRVGPRSDDCTAIAIHRQVDADVAVAVDHTSDGDTARSAEQIAPVNDETATAPSERDTVLP
jgi:serine phosphatase RsbU (regulator of sigma subunit)/CHASE3 domain sensor protein